MIDLLAQFIDLTQIDHAIAELTGQLARYPAMRQRDEPD